MLGAIFVSFDLPFGRPFGSIFGLEIYRNRKNKHVLRRPRGKGISDRLRTGFRTISEGFSKSKNEEKCGMLIFDFRGFQDGNWFLIDFGCLRNLILKAFWHNLGYPEAN